MDNVIERTVAITGINITAPVSVKGGKSPQDINVLNGREMYKGDKGDRGDSAYELAIANGFEGTEEEWIESLHGKDGADGYTPQKNVDYFDGKDGYTPVKGVDYFDGKDGYTPVKGKDYFDGKDGQDGYTPVKGTDYFTQEDRQEIVDELKSQGGGGGIAEEVDPTVPSWAKQPNKPTYTASEVGALPNTTEIPTRTSDLTNDSGFLTGIPSEYVTESELNSKGYLTEHQDLSDYAKKTDIPTVPTKTSQLSNDSGFLTAVPSEYITDTELTAKGYLTQHQDLSSYAKKTELPTKTSQLTNDSGYLTAVPSEYVTDSELTAKGYLTSIPAEYVTDSELNSKGYLTQHQDLSDYAKKTDIPSVPTKTSQLTNDSGYLTAVPSEYVTESELAAKGYLTQHQSLTDYAKKSEIPTKVSQLTNDSKYVTETELTNKGYAKQSDVDDLSEEIADHTGNTTSHVTATEKQTWNNKSNFSGSYNDLTNKPTIPSKTSQLANDSNFLTSVPSEYVTETELTAKGYAKQTEVTNLSNEIANLPKGNVAYATCETAAGTAAKVVTVTSDDNWSLSVGSVVMVYFTTSNSASNVTLNVNGSGAYPIWYNNAAYTSTGTAYTGYAKRVINYVFNGTHWVWIGSSYDANSTYSNASLGQGYATCTTAEATVAKVGTLSSYAATAGGVVSVKFTYAVPASATLNINSKGAKKIFYRGVAITAGVIKAGDIATFIYDGTQYHLLSIDRWQNDITTLTNSLPTKMSQLANDVHFVTSDVTDHLADEIVQLREDLTAEPLEEVDTVIRYAADGSAGTKMPEFVGWYITAEGALADAANQYQYLTKAIPILPNTVITYKLLYLTSQEVMAFYDENGNYISGVKGTTNNTTIEGTAEIPANAKMVMFNFRYSFTGLYAQVKYTTEGTPTITEQSITSSGGSGDIKTSGQKAYSSTDGSVMATSAYEYVDKMALDADVVSVTCFGKGASSIGLAVFFDKDNVFLSSCAINSSSRIIKSIHAPAGAEYVGFTHLAGDTKAIYHMTTIKYEEQSGGNGGGTSETNQWVGKKWYAFGTSITDTSYTNAETGSVTGKYVPYLVRESGMIVTNYGKAGGCIASGGVHGGSADILTRILATNVSDADLITLEGFVNDFACAITIGDVGDTGQTTLCGALYQAINYFQQNSNAVVVLLTEHTGRKYTLTSTGGEADYTINKKNSIDKFQSDYNEAIRKMAKHMGCYLIDAGAESQINENHPEYLIDHLHHTELGGQQYAKVIWSHLKDIPCMVTT